VELVTYFFVGGTSILCIASLRKAEKQARDNAQALQQEKMELEIHIQKRKQPKKSWLAAVKSWNGSLKSGPPGSRKP